MNIARVVGGYSLGQADMLRRAMGKKKPEEMQKHKEIFLKGAGERNFDLAKAEQLYDLMAKFAEYGFNKSHAVAYALIAYQTAYLKYYYPAAFFAALLGSEMGNTDKITVYIKDAKQYGVEILKPDVNESLWHFNVLGSTIRFGMGAVKNVGEGPVRELIAEREKNGPFKSFIDFCERVNMKSINKRVIESLIKVGAFDSCEKLNRKTLLENLELITTYASKKQEEIASGQASLFDLDGGGLSAGTEKEELLDIHEVPDFDEKEKLGYELSLIGIYVSGHPLEKFADIMSQMTSMSISAVQDSQGKGKRDMVLAGLFSTPKVLLTKKGDKMAFVNLEDLTGKIECIVFPRTFEEYQTYLTSDDPVILTGTVNMDEEVRKFFPTKIQFLKEQAESRVSAVRINIDTTRLHEHSLSKLKQIILSYRGSVPAHLIIKSQDARARLPLSGDYLVNPTPQLAAKINELLDENAVNFIIDGKITDGSQEGIRS
jgi:DNA polymerase-3 subunit alpha